MSDTLRPQIAKTDDIDINQAVEKYAEENGMTKKEAWSDLVQRGLSCPSGADVTIVVDGDKIPQAIFSDEEVAEKYAHKLVEKMAQSPEYASGEAGWKTLTVDSTSEMEWAKPVEGDAGLDT